MNFRRSIITAELWRPEVPRRWKNVIFSFFLEKRPRTGSFKIPFRKDSAWHPLTCCVQILWNLADGKSVNSCVIYPTKTKKQNFAWLSSSRHWTDRTQKLPVPAPDNVLLRVLQISSKSVHFRRNYIRTRERRQSTHQSEYNIRLN